MNTYFISYDLHTPGQRYDTVRKKIEEFGTWAKIHQSFWFVRSTLSTEELAKRIWSVMDSNDSLIVVNSTTNQGRWYNLSTEVSDYLRSNWR